MTIIKSLFFVRAHGAIEPCLFAASYLTIFTTSASSADPTFQRHVFLHNMESSTIFSGKEIWRIRRGSQSTNIISEATEMADGSIYGVYRAILCRGGLSPMVIGGRCKSGMSKSAVKGSLKQS